jgi:acyl-CoA thioester hydrolase
MWSKTVTPRFGDIDGLRHINNCMLPIWFETAREPFFRLFHPNLNLNEEWRLIMAKIMVEFVQQMRLGADIEIRTFIKKLGRSSMTLYQEAWQDGVLGAKGEAVVVHYDFQEKKSLPIPDDIREELERNMIPEEQNSNPRTRSGRFPAN